MSEQSHDRRITSMCCRSTIQKFTDCLSKQARTHHKMTVHPGSHNASILHYLYQHSSKRSTDDSGNSTQHCLICANQSAPHTYANTSATARSLAAVDFIPQFPSAPLDDFNDSTAPVSPDGAPNPPSLNGSTSPLLAALTPVAASPTTDAAFSEFATTLSDDTTSPLAYPPASPPASPPVSYSVSAPHGPYSSRNNSGTYDDSNPKAQKTEMAYGLGGLGLIVLILVCACLLARHVKVSILLQTLCTTDACCCSQARAVASNMSFY